MKVNYDGLVFNEEGYGADDNGVFWYVTGFDGWDNPEVRQTVSEPTSRHGNVVAKGLLSARAMTLRGIVKAPDIEKYWVARETLAGKTNNIFQTKPLVVTEDRDRTIQVVRAAGLRMREAGMCAFEFELPISAPDPLKYGAPVTTTINAGQTKPIDNEGTFPTEAWAFRTLTDGHVMLQNLTYGGKMVTDQGAEAQTVFNAHTRTVRDADGRPTYSVLAPSASWWSLQPGVQQVRNSGPTNVSFTHYPAWL